MASISEIAVVTVPAFSHQASILEMCKRLVQVNHHLHVTCFIPTLGSPPPASLSTVGSLPSSISCTFLPPVNLDDHPDRDGLSLEVQIHLAVARSMPLVREAVVKSRAMVLVAEPLSIEALKIGKEMGILSYLYFPCSAMMLSLCFYSSKLNREVSSEFRDVPGGLIHIPGCVPVSANDLPDNHQDRSGLAYSHFLQRCQLYRLAQGILVNSFTEMEGEAIRAWEAEKDGKGEYPGVYAIGPIIRTGSSSSDSEPGRDTCLEWLDRQPTKSVVYVSFGSGGRLSESQTREIALGLELSGERFLWANVKSPSDKASASYLRSNEENEEALRFLPEGFLERTKERGMVLTRWVPQVEILSHESTGAFVSHCGWNSVLESVARGVPVIAWPLFAEQRTNAVMLVEGLKVAVRPRREKEELARVIKCVMMEEEGEGEGGVVRKRMREMRDAAASAVMEGGSSTTTIFNLALQWTTFRPHDHDDDAA